MTALLEPPAAAAVDEPLLALPDTYIIGAPKAGTTSLATWLAEHPDVFFSNPKEPFYWAADYPRLREHYGFATPDAYARLFSSREARQASTRAEGSTTYLYSETAVPDILDAIPGARFVVCLREPAALLASYHRTQVVTLNEHEVDFERAWRLRVDGSLQAADPIDSKLVDYPLVGRLGAAVLRLVTRVPREQIHFVIFDDLVSDSAGEWRKLSRFLGLAEDNRHDFTARNPSDSMYRSRRLRKVLHRPPRLAAAPVRAVRQWSRESDSATVRRLKEVTWRPESKPQMSQRLCEELVDYFREDVRQLSGLIGRDLRAWTDTRAVGHPSAH